MSRSPIEASRTTAEEPGVRSRQLKTVFAENRLSRQWGSVGSLNIARTTVEEPGVQPGVKAHKRIRL
jgi:hypothetical protein